jgi:hypothetical protein
LSNLPGPAALRQALVEAAIAEDWTSDGATILADVAIRRWRSYTRRHDPKRGTFDDRVRDLARGLRQRSPVDPIYVPRGDFYPLAVRLAAVLQAHDGQQPGIEG